MLNLVKLCVGAASIEDLAAWQKNYPGFKTGTAAKLKVYHTTFQAPKRQTELLDGGSLYWVIKGFIQARQHLTGFEDGHKEDGSKCCLLLLDPKIVAVRPQPRKAFQGWRYLTAADAPPDLPAGAGDTLASMPPHLRKELAALGLI
ncbi:MAG: DUF1489 domain-containing protein [Hyphomicrobium sp.]